MSRQIPARTDFSIVAMADEWLVVGKPAPLIVHPTNDRVEVTLLGELKLRWPDEEFFFINRLDRETSGCVLIAKSRGAARVFGKQMMRRKIQKGYRAIVHGWPDWEEKRVEAPIIRKGEVEESAIWVRQMVHESGKDCATCFSLEGRFERNEGRFAIVRCEPETGRTHQLRVHLEHLGHPIVGDKIYGGDGSCYLDFLEGGWTNGLVARLLLSRQALHGSDLGFVWEGEEIVVSCAWPDDLDEFCLGDDASEPLH